MAASSECDLTTSAISAKGICITPDRRKRAFKSLVSDIAERLESKDIKNICWQLDLPNSLLEKTALDVLKWLVQHGKCSEIDVHPLAQLLQDIHREDLAGKVETFRKEFGQCCSVPQNSHDYNVHDVVPAASTHFGSVPNCTDLVQEAYTSSGTTSTLSEAQQESSAAIHEDSCEDCLDVSVCSEASYASVFLLPSESSHRVSETSIPFTLDSSSTSNSLLEMPPPVGQYPPSGLTWHFPSNSSSGNVSQENMLLHSSYSDIMEPNVMDTLQYQPRPTAQDIPYPRNVPWYRQSSLANLSTPVHVADHSHGSYSSMAMFPPRYPYCSMLPTVGLPMSRSMSQDYHMPLRKNHHSVPHRRHTFTPADRQHKVTLHRVVQATQKKARASKEPPQNQNCCAQLPYCQNSNNPDTHCGQLGPRVHPVSPALHMNLHGHCQPCAHIRHFSNECLSQKILRKGWESGEYGEEFNASKYPSEISTIEHRELPQINDHQTGSDYEYHHHIPRSCNYIQPCQFGDVESSDAESESSSVGIISRNGGCRVSDCHLKEQTISRIKKRNSVPVFQSQCLEFCEDSHSTKSVHDQRKSLDVSALKRGSKCISTSSASIGTSLNTLTGSATNCKSPVSSPPIIRNKADARTKASEYSALAPHLEPSTSEYSVSTVSEAATSKWRPVSGLFHTKPKPRLIESNKLVWPIKRDKLNKYIYKHKTKLLRCKLNLELVPEHEIGPGPKLSLQLHPYGAEEDSNKYITAKVSIESKKCRLHSDTRIQVSISAKEGDPSSGAVIGRLQEKQEQITQMFFYIKQFIDHQDLKNSTCDYVYLVASAKLIMP